MKLILIYDQNGIVLAQTTFGYINALSIYRRLEPSVCTCTPLELLREERCAKQQDTRPGSNSMTMCFKKGFLGDLPIFAVSKSIEKPLPGCF